MEYIVQKPHIFRGEKGEPLPKMIGERVNVDNRKIAQKLINQGTIALENLAPNKKSYIKASSFSRTFRVGAFIHTSTFYSGGRIHLYQVCLTLAKMGAEVYLITDNNPKWLKDYPSEKNLTIVNSKDSQCFGAPQDLDLLFTDGKGWAAQHVMRWKRENPFVPVVCLNFETPNWVAKYAPECAPKMPEMSACYDMADCMLCNSGESLKWLGEFMDLPELTGVLPPAVNTHALDQNVSLPDHVDMTRDYVVWSARGSAYKGAQVIVEAVFRMDRQMDLIMIGKPSAIPKSSDLHRFVKFSQPINDAQKMKLIAGAKAVAAPSRFEGYGMVPAEALSNGVPVVVYDLPVLRQNYGDRLVYAKWNNPTDFAEKLTETIENPPAVDKEEARETYGLEAMERHIESLPFMNFGAKRVSAQMIVYYGSTVQEAIASIYDHSDEIIVAYGCTALWSGFPDTGVLDLLHDCPDPDKKIRIIEAPRECWENKGEMRRACQAKMTGNYLLIVDADEIYHGLDKWIENDIDFGCPRWVHFWHDLDHYVVDSAGMDRWGKPHELGGGIHNHFRWAYWRYSNQWYSTRGTVAKDANGQRLTAATKMRAAVARSPETCIYHLGHVLDPKLMSAKHEFYLTRDGRDAGRVRRATAWHNWNGELGDCGDGIIQKVGWDLPELVQTAYEKIRRGSNVTA